jgi:hypothetical protein
MSFYGNVETKLISRSFGVSGANPNGDPNNRSGRFSELSDVYFKRDS